MSEDKDNRKHLWLAVLVDYGITGGGEEES